MRESLNNRASSGSCRPYSRALWRVGTTEGCDNQDKSKSGFMSNTPEQNAKEVADKLTSTQEVSAVADRLTDKDDQLSKFQKTNDISERIAEAAIKEWIYKHSSEFDWNLEDVKAICLRNERDGIPNDYLPESEKRK